MIKSANEILFIINIFFLIGLLLAYIWLLEYKRKLEKDFSDRTYENNFYRVKKKYSRDEILLWEKFLGE